MPPARTAWNWPRVFSRCTLLVTPVLRFSYALRGPLKSDSQTLASLGTTGVYHGATATGLHANQETVRAGAANLGGLVSSFHVGNPKVLDIGLLPVGHSELSSCHRRRSQSNLILSQIFPVAAIPAIWHSF